MSRPEIGKNKNHYSVSAPARVEGYQLPADLHAPLTDTAGPMAFDVEAAILAYVREHRRITRRKVMEHMGLDEEPAKYRLRKLVEQHDLQLVGSGRGAYYQFPETGKNGE